VPEAVFGLNESNHRFRLDRIRDRPSVFYHKHFTRVKDRSCHNLELKLAGHSECRPDAALAGECYAFDG